MAISRFSRAGRESFKLNRLSEGGSVPRNGVFPAGERVGPAGKVLYASAVAAAYGAERAKPAEDFLRW